MNDQLNDDLATIPTHSEISDIQVPLPQLQGIPGLAPSAL
jgi:hypothetical protein